MPIRLLIVGLILIVTPVVRGADLFVSPSGNDAWSGKLAEPNAAKNDGPLASLDGARLKVREILKQPRPDPKQPIIVELRGGTYFLTQPITFTPEDSGRPEAPVIYRNVANETPILSGGQQVSNWKVQPDGRWTVTLEDVRSGKWDFSQLFVNGERRMRPRLPKKGYYSIAARVPTPADPKDPKKSQLGDDRFRYAGDEIRADWKNRSDVEMISFHPWFTSMLRIKDVDAATKTVIFGGHTRTPVGYGQLRAGMRYLVENVAEALSEPGEWYLDRASGVLTYIPKPGETPKNSDVIAPRLPQLLILNGDPKAAALVSNIQFRGLTFAHSNWTTPPEGSSIAQAAVSIGGMVFGSGTQNVHFDGCTFTQGGTYGLELAAGCKESRIDGCRFIDLGAGGVKIGTTALPTSDGLLTEKFHVHQNLMAHLGRIHSAAVGVWIGQAANVTVEQNDIYDLYYTPISSGWVWGYGKTANHDIHIKNNDLHHYGQGVLGDMGGVYTLGASPNSVIEGNRMHDCERAGYGGWGVYYDEGSSGWIARNNLLHRLHDGGFHQHYGAENVMENNVLLDSRDVQWGPTRVDSTAAPGKVIERTAITFQRNIISGWGAGSVIRGETVRVGQNNPDKLKVDHNLYWNGGKDVKFGPMSFAEWQKLGLDKDSEIADPKLPKNVDDPGFAVPEDSPAVKLGFKPFKLDSAGRPGHEPADLDPKRWPRWFPSAN
jgi:hypothetical protein